MGDFRKLKVWQESIELCKEVYEITRSDQYSKDFELRGQTRKSSVSIPSNIAEGDESGTNKQSIRYFNIVKGSCAELLTQIIIAFEVKYLDEEIFKRLEKNAIKYLQCSLIL